MNQQQQTQRDVEIVNAIVERLREHYLTRRPLPDTEGRSLTLKDFYRLYRYVLAEGYGR